MTYPSFKNKHLEIALFHPKDYVDYRFKKLKDKLPKKYIITYQPSTKRYFLKKYKPKKYEFYSLLDVYVYKGVGFVKMSGIGAPNASTVFEELIAIGGKEFINVGTAGGLHKEGIYLCTKALRDEGTSHHYIKPGKYINPHEAFTKRFAKCLTKEGIPFEQGTTWTIDAPYRETKAEIEKYAKKGIKTVEMEASALFAVAKYRKVKIASSFVVSDVLGKKWQPNFHRFDIKKAQNNLIDVAVKCLRGKK